MNEKTSPTNWKEYRRFRAWELAQQGWKQCDIAVALGVTKGAVSQWLKRARVDAGGDVGREPG
jgi:predicted transcriptional regulator